MAPELLQGGVTHPDHVEQGTKEGDIYRSAKSSVPIQ